MKIVINTAHQRIGGAIQVALSFIYECRKYPENEYHIFVGPGVKESLNENDFPANFKFYYFDFGEINILKTFKINNILRKFEKIINPDCIFSTSGPSYYKSFVPQILGFNLFLYIFPESPYFKNFSHFNLIKFKLKKAIHTYYFKRDASAFVVQSDDVKKRVEKQFKSDRVYTVTNTVNGYYLNWHQYDNKLPIRNKSEIRLITISNFYFHKNLDIIPKISNVLRKRRINNIKFVLTLKKSDYNKYIEYDENIINVGPIKPEECPSLYNECDILFLPTLAECFSASYPEAMFMRKPIITTDLGFARSICHDAAIYYEPMNHLDAANKIEKLINNKTLQNKLISNGILRLKSFNSAAERAKNYLAICSELISENK